MAAMLSASRSRTAITSSLLCAEDNKKILQHQSNLKILQQRSNLKILNHQSKPKNTLAPFKSQKTPAPIKPQKTPAPIKPQKTEITNRTSTQTNLNRKRNHWNIDLFYTKRPQPNHGCLHLDTGPLNIPFELTVSDVFEDMGTHNYPSKPAIVEARRDTLLFSFM